MWAGKTGELVVCEKGCKYGWGKCSPFLSLEMTKLSAPTRVKLLLFHPLVRVRLVKVARRTFRHQCDIFCPPVEAVAVQKILSLLLVGNNTVGQQQ